jgi:hypothetical protein
MFTININISQYFDMFIVNKAESLGIQLNLL